MMLLVHSKKKNKGLSFTYSLLEIRGPQSPRAQSLFTANTTLKLQCGNRKIMERTRNTRELLF